MASASRKSTDKSASAAQTTASQTAKQSESDDAKTTTDHNTIREWVEARNGRPSHVAETAQKKGELGILRIDFGAKDDNLEEVSWAKFLKAFDKNKLAFLYKESTASGRKSRFCKFIDRET